MDTSAPLDLAAPHRPGVASLFSSALLEPGRVADAIRRGEAPLLVPVVALLAATVLLLGWYYAKLDYAWFGEHLRATNPVIAKYAGRGTLHLSREALLAPAVLAAAAGVAASWLLTALYLGLVGKMLQATVSWRQWFALSAWSTAPALVLLPLGAFMILTHGDGRLAPEELDPATIAMMLQVPAGSTLHAAAAKVSLATLWSCAILAAGLRRWTHLGYPRALAIALAPQAAWFALGLVPALLL